MLTGALAAARVVAATLSPKGWLVVGAVSLLVFMGAGWWCANQRVDRLVQQQATQQADLQKGAREADNNAADARLTDERTIDRQTESLNDAVRDLPDARPSDRRIARNCQRMRNAGRTDLPAECGPDR